MTKRVQGIGSGAGITRFSLEIMKEYGLEQAGYTFHTGAQAMCVKAFENAIKQQDWVVVPLWQPQFLQHIYAIRELDEPKGLLGEENHAVLLARTDQLEKFTENEIQLLDRLRLSNAIVSLLDYAIDV